MYLAEYFHFLSSYVEDYDVAVNKINFKFAQTILRLSYLEKGSKRSSQKVTTQTYTYVKIIYNMNKNLLQLCKLMSSKHCKYLGL